MSKYTKADQVCTKQIDTFIFENWHQWWLRSLDMRLPSSKAASQQRSINLAISSRGIAALQVIDPAATERFLKTVIPMRGRMIHDSHGNLHSQLYDKDGQVRFDFTEIKIPGQSQALLLILVPYLYLDSA